MRVSAFFMPTMKDTPTEAQIISHRLMLRAGMIRQTSAGIYAWLPLGHRVLRKIEQIVREEQDAAGALELLMPTIQSAELWKTSGRYEDYGKEMLRIRDRHEREMLFGPTAEEVITDIVHSYIKSYREVPKNFYNIQWKFRDEIRPRFGVMRGREFLMKDAYSFDLDYAGARRAYQKMFLAYLRTFARLGLRAIPMKAESGPIGGDMSHEFIILADTGESAVFCDRQWVELDVLANAPSFDDDLEAFFTHHTGIYAATEEKHDAATCPLPEAQLVTARGIEVGHIFYFGTKYSKPLGAVVAGPNSEPVTLEMGSYGIGVSRLVAAIIEASHDDAGIIWPESVAPYKVALINLKQGDTACDKVCEDLYDDLRTAGVEVLYDDRAERPGVKFADMDLIGLPWHLVVGPRGLKTGSVELKNRRTGEKIELSQDSALARLSS